MRIALVATLLGGLLASTACLAGEDISKLNGSIRVEDGRTVGDLDTVNGSIRVGDNVNAEDVETVNGSIEIGHGASLKSVGAVNGRISLGERVRVEGEVEAVNGSIRIGNGSDIVGRLSNVNGAIHLDAAHVGGGIETVSGDIDIGGGSRVEGGLLVNKPSGWFNNSRPPRIIIGPDAVVQGKLEFRREVELHVSDSATVGEIVGATPKRFSGDKP